MFLHLGKDTVVNTKNIVSILDLDSTSVSKYSKEFFRIVEEEGFVKNVSTDLPKSLIICDEDGKSVVYVTNISTKALSGRIRKRETEF